MLIKVFGRSDILSEVAKALVCESVSFTYDEDLNLLLTREVNRSWGESFIRVVSEAKNHGLQIKIKLKGEGGWVTA